MSAACGTPPLGCGAAPIGVAHAMLSGSHAVDGLLSPQSAFDLFPPTQSQAQNLALPFAEDSLRHLHGNEGDSGAVVAPANLSQPAAVGAAKDACAESHVARNMIGSDRPLSRPATAGSAATVAPVSSTQVPERRCSPAYHLSCDTSAPALSNCLPTTVRSQGDLASTARPLQADCSTRDLPCTFSRDEGAMSPVPAPAGLHRIRLQRPCTADTAEVARNTDAGDFGVGDGESDAGAAADLWAGASPFMSARTQSSAPNSANFVGGQDSQSADCQQQEWQQTFDDVSTSVPSRGANSFRCKGRVLQKCVRSSVRNYVLWVEQSVCAGRVTVRRAMLRYSSNYLLSAMHLPQHPEGPAVMLLSQADALFETISSLFREPVMRQSRGYVAVQAAARLSGSLVSTIWDVLDGSVLEPALLSFEGQGGEVY